jgi:hypothetical protein
MGVFLVCQWPVDVYQCGRIDVYHCGRVDVYHCGRVGVYHPEIQSHVDFAFIKASFLRES